MTIDDVRQVIFASVARGSSTPTNGEAAESYAAREAAHLEAALIPPAPARVTAELNASGLMARLAAEVPLTVARHEAEWLCLLPSTGEFFLAFGAAQEELQALGFFADDALAEWLG